MGNNRKKENLFEMGGNGGNGWSSDNRQKEAKAASKILHKDRHELMFKKEMRRGKPVTLVGPFYHDEATKKKLAKLIKSKIASGGSVKDEWLEFQGDLKEKIRPVLINEGYKFRPKH